MDSKFYLSQLLRVRDSVPDAERRYFDEQFRQKSINPVTLFGVSAWLGFYGVDRFMLGQNLLGAMKLLITLFGVSAWLGLLGIDGSHSLLGAFMLLAVAGIINIWYVADLLRIGGMVRRRNMAVAIEMRDSLSGRWT